MQTDNVVVRYLFTRRTPYLFSEYQPRNILPFLIIKQLRQIKLQFWGQEVTSATMYASYLISPSSYAYVSNIFGNDFYRVLSKMNILVFITCATLVCVTTAQINTGEDQGTQALISEIQAMRKEMEELKTHHILHMNDINYEMSQYKKEVLALKKRLDQADNERHMQRQQNVFLRKQVAKTWKERLIVRNRFQALLDQR